MPNFLLLRPRRFHMHTNLDRALALNHSQLLFTLQISSIPSLISHFILHTYYYDYCCIRTTTTYSTRYPFTTPNPTSLPACLPACLLTTTTTTNGWKLPRLPSIPSRALFQPLSCQLFFHRQPFLSLTLSLYISSSRQSILIFQIQSILGLVAQALAGLCSLLYLFFPPERHNFGRRNIVSCAAIARPQRLPSRRTRASSALCARFHCQLL